MKTCSMKRCGRSIQARDLCGPHYGNWHRAQKKYTIVCPACGITMAVARKRSKYCSAHCAQLVGARASALASQRRAAERQAARPKELVLYSPPPRPTTPERLPASRTLVSGRCLHCNNWFTSTNRRDQTCSTGCRDHYALDSKRRGKHRRRALQRNAYVADVYRRKVYEADGYRCHICHRKTDPTKRAPHPRSPTIDHVIPLNRGGTHEPVNCRTACFQCNTSKSDGGGGEQLLLLAV